MSEGLNFDKEHPGLLGVLSNKEMVSIFLLLVLVSTIEFFGDMNLKSYARTDNGGHLALGFAFYGIMLSFLVMAFKQSNLIFVNGMWNGVYTILATLLAYYFFGERLSNGYQWIGLLLIVAGTFFMSVGIVPY